MTQVFHTENHKIVHLQWCTEKSAALNVAIELPIHFGSESDMGTVTPSSTLLQEAVDFSDEPQLSVHPDH